MYSGLESRAQKRSLLQIVAIIDKLLAFPKYCATPIMPRPKPAASPAAAGSIFFKRPFFQDLPVPDTIERPRPANTNSSSGDAMDMRRHLQHDLSVTSGSTARYPCAVVVSSDSGRRGGPPNNHGTSAVIVNPAQ